MSRYVTDTHAFVWHLQSSAKLSQSARTVFREADAGANEIVVPSIVLVELVYLAERKRIEVALVNRTFDAISSVSVNYSVAPLDAAIARALQDVDRDKVPEMPDRIIAATAKHLNLPVITRDSRISSSALVQVVW